MKEQLENKLKYMLSSQHRERGSAHSMISELQKIDDVALVGGAIRDIALFGNRTFSSDIDLVIDPIDREKYDLLIEKNSVRKNRFGGYELVLSGSWKIDVWTLEDTWSTVQGYVEADGFHSLTKSTFFSSDAIVYDLSKKHLIHSSNYFDLLQKRLLDINLSENPNPVGNAIRSVRYSYIKGFSMSRSLASFVFNHLKNEPWMNLIRIEQKSFGNSVLQKSEPKMFLKSVEEFLDNDTAHEYRPCYNEQLELFN